MEPMIFHGLESRKTAYERALFLLNKLGLNNPSLVFKKYPHELSGGQIQRVMIAAALSCNPELLIADEPTTALDTAVQRQVLDLLRAAQEQFKMSMLFITHDLGVVADLAHEVGVIRNGVIEEQASTDIIFSMAQSNYTKGLLACRPPAEFRPQRLATMEDFQNGRKIPRETRPTIDSRADSILSLQSISKSFGKKNYLLRKSTLGIQALNSLSLKVRKSVNLGVVGASGSGKTTLAMAMARLVNLDEGKIVFEGQDLSHHQQHQLKSFRRRVQYIFQDSYAALNPEWTIQKIMMEPMVIHQYPGVGERQNKINSLLDQVGLDHLLLSKKPGQLSGGQRQRVCIARVLTLDPELIILDESVSALDVSTQANILNLLLYLQSCQDVTYVFVSHDLGLVKFFADEIIVMDQGNIVEQGPSQEVFNEPQHDCTKALIHAAPFLGKRSHAVLKEVYEWPNQDL